MGRLITATVVFLTLGACVIMDSTLTLEHTPAMDPIVGKPHPVFLSRVTDRRRESDRIGCKKSSMGSESADLYLDVLLTDWFGGVLNDELRRAGLQLNGAAGPGTFRLEVELLDFFIEPKAAFGSSYHVYAMVNAEVLVRFPDGRAFARRFTSHADDTSMLPTDGTYEDLMQEAMAAWIREAVPHIVQLLDTGGQLRAEAAGWNREVRG